jgi:hypothetical protein
LHKPEKINFPNIAFESVLFEFLKNPGTTCSGVSLPVFIDNWDPITMDGLAKEGQVSNINNTGIGNSGGLTLENIQEMMLAYDL